MPDVTVDADRSALKPRRWFEASLWHGMGLAAWLRLLARNRGAVSPSRLGLAASISASAAVNSLLGTWQRVAHGRRIAATPIAPAPTFIVGHWRTGTTLLHELLALDPANRCPTTYESLSPCHFLVSDRWLRPALAAALPKTRPMDAMRVSFDLPQEDEVALALLGCPSTFLSVAFPDRPPQDPESLALDGLAPAALARWEATWLAFLKALLVRRPGRLVLKSPQHTFRVPHILRLFPEARFIYLVRDPFAVFPSTVHFWASMAGAHAIQARPPADLEETVLETFRRMHDRFEATRSLIPAGRLVELRYEDLAADPAAAIRVVYAGCGWPDVEAVLPAVARYAKRTRSYRPNEFPTLPPARVAAIRDRWRPYFLRHGYPLEAAAGREAPAPALQP
jgi:hypothetical protein